MGEYYLGMGGNLGEPRETFRRAVSGWRARGIHTMALSPAYLNPPMRLPRTSTHGVPGFWNAAAKIWSALPPRDLLEVLLDTEEELGRRRGARWASRTLDIDIVLGPERVDLPGLRIPHPGLTTRPFVLRPLLDICPWLKHPTTGVPLALYLSATAPQFLARDDAWQHDLVCT